MQDTAAPDSNTTAAAAKSEPEAEPRALTDEDRQRCVGAIGTWCGPYYTQPPMPDLEPPQGNRTCVLDCNGVGVCDGFLGEPWVSYRGAKEESRKGWMCSVLGLRLGLLGEA